MANQNSQFRLKTECNFFVVKHQSAPTGFATELVGHRVAVGMARQSQTVPGPWFGRRQRRLAINWGHVNT